MIQEWWSGEVGLLHFGRWCADAEACVYHPSVSRSPPSSGGTVPLRRDHPKFNTSSSLMLPNPGGRVPLNKV